MKIASEFGRADVDRWLSEISSRQLTEWIEFFRTERFREEMLVGAIAKLGVQICNRLAPPAVTTGDFIPEFGEAPEESSGVLGIGKRLAAAGLPVKFERKD